MTPPRFFRYVASALLAALVQTNAWAAPRPSAPPTVPPSDTVHFDVNRERSAELFDTAVQKWKQSFDPAAMRSELKAISKGGAISPEASERLKLMRKDGSVLRGSFLLFGKSHDSPANVERFVTDFGKLNDAIANGNSEQTVHYAKAMLKGVDKATFDKQIRAFEPASRKSFDSFLASNEDFLRKGLKKESVPAPEFHKMRKALTKVLSILSLAPELRKDPAVEKLYQQTFTLQTNMGLMHDDLVAKSLRGEVDYEHYDVKIPAKMKTDLGRILDTIE